MSAITDDEILAAWNADVAAHGDSVPLNPACMWGMEFWKAVAETDSEAERLRLNLWHPGDERRVALVRDKLGGVDRVWRAVLEDEGFEPIASYAPNLGWTLSKLHLQVVPDRGGKSLCVGTEYLIPLASPADLRRRVKAARDLFGE